MNDATLKELKIVVERTVRPVGATIVRKRKIREELLAHLTAIFEEELSKLRDERAALDQARRRFGDPRELSTQIQETVPRRDRLNAFFDGFLGYRPGESASAHALRAGAFMFFSFLPTLLLVIPICWIRERQEELKPEAIILLATAVCLGGLFFVMTLAGHGIYRALFSSDSRSYLRAAFYLPLSALFVPVAGYVLVWTATGSPMAGYMQLRSLGWTIPVVPIVLCAALWQVNKDYRDHYEWASLVIEEPGPQLLH